MLDGVVAITAIETQLSHMQCMAIGHGLGWLVAHFERLWTQSIRHHVERINRGGGSNNERERKQKVGPTGELELTHNMRSPSS